MLQQNFSSTDPGRQEPKQICPQIGRVPPNLLSVYTSGKDMLHSFIIKLTENTPIGIESHSSGARLTSIDDVNSFVKKGPYEKLTFFRKQKGPKELHIWTVWLSISSGQQQLQGFDRERTIVARFPKDGIGFFIRGRRGHEEDIVVYACSSLSKSVLLNARFQCLCPTFQASLTDMSLLSERL